MRPRRRDSPRAATVGQAERSARYRNLVNPFEPIRIFSDDQVEAMHLAALDILERQGMRVLSPADGQCSPQPVPRWTSRARWSDSSVASVTTALRRISAEGRSLRAIRRAPAGWEDVTWCSRRSRAAERQRSSARQAHRHDGGLPRLRTAVAGLRRHSRARPDGRTAGHPVPSATCETTLAQLTLGDKVPYFYCRGDGAACGLLRDAAHRPRHRRSDVSQRAALLLHLQHQFAAAARRADDGRHHRVCDERPVDDRYPVYTRRRDGADHDLRRSDTGTCGSAVRYHAVPDRAAGCPGDVRQLHLKRRHEVGITGIRHAGIRQGGLRCRTAGTTDRCALALLECHGIQRPGRASRCTSRR